MICTFTGWVEAYPTKTEKLKEVARFLLRDIIPRFGFPLNIGSDNGPAFVAELLQLDCKAVNIKWKLHTAYRPQSLGMVENELDHQGDFGKMGARNWRPPDGRAGIVLMRIRVTPGHTGILPMR